jgi:phospholipase C
MTDLNKIDTIIIVMMENRSFDHMLGYLSLPDYGRTDVEGLRYKANVDPPVWDSEFVLLGGYTPFRMPDTTTPLPNKMDPPHERPNIEKQRGAYADGAYPMNGFVDSFDGKIKVDGKDQPVVMGYYTGADLTTTHFFAENFLICDHWFSAIPAGTQPNRLMAMSGKTRIDLNRPNPPLPDQELAYKWLSVHDVPWRIYAESLPFYALMLDEFPCITAHLRPFSSLAHDIVNEFNDADFPKVIFVEPGYTNAPHIEPPHDDHAPTAVDGGQRFLMQVYAALTAKDEVWKRSVMIVTYDENGGFFDHMSPPQIPTTRPPDGDQYPDFESLGSVHHLSICRAP